MINLYKYMYISFDNWKHGMIISFSTYEINKNNCFDGKNYMLKFFREFFWWRFHSLFWLHFFRPVNFSSTISIKSTPITCRLWCDVMQRWSWENARRRDWNAINQHTLIYDCWIVLSENVNYSLSTGPWIIVRSPTRTRLEAVWNNKNINLENFEWCCVWIFNEIYDQKVVIAAAVLDLVTSSRVVFSSSSDCHIKICSGRTSQVN